MKEVFYNDSKQAKTSLRKNPQLKLRVFSGYTNLKKKDL